MINVGFVSYASGGVIFLILSLVLLTGRQGRPQKRLLALAALASVFWAAASAAYASAQVPAALAQSLEFVRDLAWLIFLVRVLSSAESHTAQLRRFRIATFWVVAIGVALICVVLYRNYLGFIAPFMGGVDLLIAGHLLMAVAGLVLVEQLYRNTRPELRRALKYLCMGIGGMFAYDFYMYSDALLFQRVDSALWAARGSINAMVVPVIGIAIARDTQGPLDIFVSRRIVFHTTALLGSGIYLLCMGFGGYYVRVYGGSWGVVAQAIFLFGAALVLTILLFSGQLRARLRVLISKHFFHYKYDYREEWLRFIRTLSSGESSEHLRERTLRAIAQIIESPAGLLWMLRDGGRFELVARWNMHDTLPASEPAEASLGRFLASQEWVVNLEEYKRAPEFYKDLVIPGWLRGLRNAWLVVPLIQHSSLLGFVVLARSPVRRHFNWEDCDLLKTAGRQAASHLAQFETSQALADARQFEACNRLSAYVVHDLKNLIAQLSLLVSNAARHRHNPQFIEDAVRTVENSVSKMNRLLGHLRSGCALGDNIASVDLAHVLAEVVRSKEAGIPVPVIQRCDNGIRVVADRDRLAMVLGHVVQNAQDATPRDGTVAIRLFRDGENGIIEIEDTGCGMDDSFVRERLFRPFETTKGAAGMGIGAYEARELVRALGGDVQVSSRPGVGTLFRISLPVESADGAGEPTRVEGRRYAEGERLKEIANSRG